MTDTPNLYVTGAPCHQELRGDNAQRPIPPEAVGSRLSLSIQSISSSLPLRSSTDVLQWREGCNFRNY